MGKKGVFIGVDLVKGASGKNNGSLDGQTYFTTRNGNKSGRFIRASRVKSAHKTKHSVRFTVSGAVSVQAKGRGIVRFVGVPSLAKGSEPMYGMELAEPKGVCDGTFKKCRYFSCASNHGVFEPINKVTVVESTQKAGKKKKKNKTAAVEDEEEKTEAKASTKKKAKANGARKVKSVKKATTAKKTPANKAMTAKRANKRG